MARLILLAAGGAVAFAQSALTGSLSGKLTDLHSKPLDGATLILRNAATGREARTTSGKNGTYRFAGLEPGEYSLETANSGPHSGPGHEQLRGIFISAGHEARIQAAVEFDPDSRESPASQAPVPMVIPPLPAAQNATIASEASPAGPVPTLPRSTAEKPSTITQTLEARLDPEPTGILPLAATSPVQPTLKVWPSETVAVSTPRSAPEKSSDPHPMPQSVPLREVEVSFASAAPAAPPASIQGADLPDLSSSLAVMTAKPPALRGAGMGFAVAAVCGAQGAAQLQQAFPLPGLTASRTIEPESSAPTDRLSSEQLQAPPLQGRHWVEFVLDTQVRRGGQGENTPETPQVSGRAPASVTIDGASTRWLLEAGAAAPCARLP